MTLITATKSTDTTAPVSAIISPTDGATVQTGTPVTITGTALDGEGVVGNVEVSVDGGTTWHPATGSTNWSYIWTPRVLGSVVIKSRAVDDSANLETPLPGVTVTVEQNTGPLGLWNDSIAPWIEAYPDSTPLGAVELGVKFRSGVDGFINGVRFYKGENNTGVHIGRLWTNAGALLAEASFTNETPAGWQETSFATPVPIVANTTYIASYHESSQYFAVNFNYFREEVVSPPLQAPASSPSDGNGVYRYGLGEFPNATNLDSNYWVDVIFTTEGPTPATASLWSASVTPSATSYPDDLGVELGVKFSSDSNGFITGIRFYKGDGNTGLHLGRLWTSDGTKLAEAPFSNETPIGWQQVFFSVPVLITANSIYVASYYAPTGHYAVDRPYFTSELVSLPLRAPADTVSGGNGVYQYGSGGFPSNSTQASNYWIDVIFSTTVG